MVHAHEGRPHDRELYVLRVAVLSLFAGIASAVVDDAMLRLATYAAGVAGALFLLHKINKLAKLAVQFLIRAITAYKVLERIPVIEAEQAEIKTLAQAAVTKADDAAGLSEQAAASAAESRNIVKAIARAVGVKVRGESED